ncbi:putative bifunctional diguanylate cyclase/phosphodiesterase [Vibrio salinus]|uniref:putative bifunctional diguanylate cyclase/phosphodiesterase n=1 Tax=Vibrio salinus TaxID=2899784 RepID=UPI001E33AA72|nr:bifunctional diguanylate cyclase/phosphodiesterase [Vibrio salinus]MCE0493404.1 bifunctional diguanylate cyclase/phosphodiesterase [Vibrio salinus]
MHIELEQNSSTLIELMSGVISAFPNGLIALSDSGEINLINTIAINWLGLGDGEEKTENMLDQDFRNILKRFPDLVDKIECLLINGRYKQLDLHGFIVDDLNINIRCCRMLKGVVILITKTNDQKSLYKDDIDILTQLSNRKHFEERFHKLINQNNFIFRQNAALIFFDIDNFTKINDSFNYSLGDEVLCRIANILKSRVSEGQLISRIGSDQFVILLQDHSIHEAKGFSESVRKLIGSRQFYLNENSVRITVSCGIAPFYIDTAPELNKLLSIASTACKLAKSNGKNRTYIIDSDNNEFENYIQEVGIVDELNNAIENEKFVLYGQKIASTIDSNSRYYEILLRLKSLRGDIFSPSTFIPVAERYHMMPEIDRYVMKTLFSSMGSGNEFVYSVNLSGQTISDYTVIDFINKMMNSYVFDPACIIFEITETSAMSDFNRTIEIMNSLIDLGFHFSLDDFGTGLSSFTYLKELPLDTVKIDGSFVLDIDKDKISYQMVKSIHEIGKAMGLKTVAEYVENKEIYQCLTEIGVQFVQGYYIHKPEPIVDIINKKIS